LSVVENVAEGGAAAPAAPVLASAAETGQSAHAAPVDLIATALGFLPEQDLGRRLVLHLDLAQWPALRSRGADARFLLERAVAQIDAAITRQLNAILHHARLQRLEASWRGLRWLVDETEFQLEQASEPSERRGADAIVQLRVLDVSWKELAQDAEQAIAFDQTALFRKVYEDEFGTPGGKPYGLLLGDYQVRHRLGDGHRIDDVATLSAVAGVAAAAFAPFISGLDPAFFKLQGFTELGPHLHLSRDVRTLEYLPWRNLRAHDDARFVGLTLPRMLMRLPYRDDGTRVDGFSFREEVEGVDASKYLWGNAAFAVASVMVRAFARSRWFGDIRGTLRETDEEAIAAGRLIVDVGGLVSQTPVDSFLTDAPRVAPKMTVETAVDELLEADLAKQGFITLCSCQDTEYAAFYAFPSLHEPRQYTDQAATASARLSSMLQYTMCASRVAHYIKVLARDKTGSVSEAEELQDYLHNWLVKYVSPDPSPQDRPRFPLREAEVKVQPIPGQPGCYRSIIKLLPQFQLDELAATIRLTTELAPGKVP
jgi:type VI secretion system protein ImpD